VVVLLLVVGAVVFSQLDALQIPLLPARSDPKAGATRTNDKDSAEMVWIPAGAFWMGSNDQSGNSVEAPRHKVSLDGYWIYKTEVTVAQFRAFTKQSGYAFNWSKKPRWGWLDAHPMVMVNWADAQAYAKWAGGALPTEAQWEKAAHGPNGQRYPWGSAWDAKKCASKANPDLKSQAQIDAEKQSKMLSGSAEERWGTWPGGSFTAGASPYGVQDMAGNVWEWCADYFDGQYYANSPASNPPGPSSGMYRVVRGGAWTSTDQNEFRTTFRKSASPDSDTDRDDMGFRCVISAPGP